MATQCRRLHLAIRGWCFDARTRQREDKEQNWRCIVCRSETLRFCRLIVRKRRARFANGTIKTSTTLVCPKLPICEAMVASSGKRTRRCRKRLLDSLPLLPTLGLQHARTALPLETNAIATVWHRLEHFNRLEVLRQALRTKQAQNSRTVRSYFHEPH